MLQQYIFIHHILFIVHYMKLTILQSIHTLLSMICTNPLLRELVLLLLILIG